jgi:transposase
MVVVDGEGVPLACHLDSASPAEVMLLERTLDHIDVLPANEGAAPPRPERLVCDKSYDSDGLRERPLLERDIELVCPHRRNRKRAPLQDGRRLRRYKRRWKVERTFAWLGNFRLVVRYERSLKMYREFFHVACLVITLRQL